MSDETVATSPDKRDTGTGGESGTKTESAPQEIPHPDPPQFILCMESPAYGHTLRQLTLWTHHVLLPVYGREITSTTLWCSRWWDHPEAVAQFHGPWLAWGELTGPGSEMSGPVNWHRDYLAPAMNSLRDPRPPSRVASLAAIGRRKYPESTARIRSLPRRPLRADRDARGRPASGRTPGRIPTLLRPLRPPHPKGISRNLRNISLQK
ncbi:DUF4913 domain-containing protein [Streptomyces sp. NPDC001185]|uniref:DUF4913 domain-containing protein n=1 Tax=Streptomyces sp. NPDC001185 TaxID=3154380 RepID=UPI00331EB8BF